MKPRLYIAVCWCLALVGCTTPESGGIAAPSSASEIGGPVYDVSRVTTPPRAVHRSVPHYPAAARNSGIRGEALIVFTVLVDGTVTDATIRQATNTAFGEAARSAILKRRYEPATLNGKRVN